MRIQSNLRQRQFLLSPRLDVEDQAGDLGKLPGIVQFAFAVDFHPAVRAGRVHNAELDSLVPVALPGGHRVLQPFAILLMAHGPGAWIGLVEAQFLADDGDEAWGAPSAQDCEVDFGHSGAGGAKRQAQSIGVLQRGIARFRQLSDFLAQTMDVVEAARMPIGGEGHAKPTPAAVALPEPRVIASRTALPHRLVDDV